jgi:hypothetical protein
MQSEQKKKNKPVWKILLVLWFLGSATAQGDQQRQIMTLRAQVEHLQQQEIRQTEALKVAIEQLQAYEETEQP